VTITYADGTTSKATLTVGDWFTNTAGDGWSLVATAPYWNRPTGSSYPRDHKVSLYAASLPVDQGKQVAYVTLPTSSRLHVFTMGVE
jgi:beta-glucosidase